MSAATSGNHTTHGDNSPIISSPVTNSTINIHSAPPPQDRVDVELAYEALFVGDHYPEGESVCGLIWHQGYTHYRLIISNPSQYVVEDLNIEISTNYSIADAVAYSDFTDVRVITKRQGDYLLSITADDPETGKRIGVPLKHGIDRTQGEFSIQSHWRMFTNRLPNFANITIDFATVKLNEPGGVEPFETEPVMIDQVNLLVRFKAAGFDQEARDYLSFVETD